MSAPIGPHPSESPPPPPPAEGAFQTAKVVTIAGGHTVHDSFTAFLPPLLPSFIEKLSLSDARAGALSTFLQLPGLLQFAIGHLADRTTLRWVVVMGPAVTSILMASLGWAPTYAVLAMMLFFAGISVAAFHAIAPAAIGRISGGLLGRGMGFWMVGGELGRTIGPLMVGAALGYLSLKQIAFLAVAGVLTSFVLHYLLRDVELRTHTEGEPVPWRTAIRSMRRVMSVLAGIMVLRSLMMAGLSLFLITYLSDDRQTSLFLASAAFALFEAAGVIGAFSGGWLSDRIGRRRVLLFSHIAAPAALFVFLVADLWAQIVVLPLVGLAFLSVTPVFMAMVQEEFPESRTLANGTYLSIHFAIRSLATIGFGVLSGEVGRATALGIGGFTVLAAIPLIWLLPVGKGARKAST